MGAKDTQRRMTARLVNSLYTEAMLLADEARGYFDVFGRAERESLPPLERVNFSCESLKVTTRLMHVIAWLLTQRAVEAGELTPAQARKTSRRLGDAVESDPKVVEQLPAAALHLVNASRELYARVQRLDEGSGSADPQPSPARSLMSRLERSL